MGPGDARRDDTARHPPRPDRSVAPWPRPLRRRSLRRILDGVSPTPAERVAIEAAQARDHAARTDAAAVRCLRHGQLAARCGGGWWLPAALQSALATAGHPFQAVGKAGGGAASCRRAGPRRRRRHRRPGGYARRERRGCAGRHIPRQPHPSQGTDFSVGEALLGAGRRLGPQAVARCGHGAWAGAGAPPPRVAWRPATNWWRREARGQMLPSSLGRRGARAAGAEGLASRHRPRHARPAGACRQAEGAPMLVTIGESVGDRSGGAGAGEAGGN